MLGMSNGQTLFILFLAVTGAIIVALSIITSVENVRVAKHKASVHEIECPQCGATIRARMADKEPDRQPTVE